MQVILLENISKLGKIGDLVKVKNGYARNFLLKKNKALRANKENIDEILKDSSEIEQNSNQILEFTKEVKIMDEDNKIRIVETLWKIIYSNKEADIYETNLMRRLAGLLYIDSKIMGDIKEKIKKENS